MKIPFIKYQGTGNDFILVDNRGNLFDPKRLDLVRKLCDRKFGVGSDGLMLLGNSSEVDFEMTFFNPDGSQSLCGNGSRCIVAYAKSLGIVNGNIRFRTFDGIHEAVINGDTVSVKMNDVTKVEKGDGYYFLNTGSPHYCRFVEVLDKYPVVEEGRKVRYGGKFGEGGTNANFLEKKDSIVMVRTYERGVENETLSCGTGVTASALVAALAGASTAAGHCDILTPGGKLRVRFKRAGDGFTDIWLEGPAVMVYKGEVEI